MASYRKRGDAWRVEVFKAGVRDSRTFDTKQEAVDWAARREAEILSTAVIHGRKETLRDALIRYAKEVSPKKRGCDWELKRIEAMCKHQIEFIDQRLETLDASHWAKWRDDRLKLVSSGTVRREITLLRSIVETARKEWKWIEVNPWKDVDKPQDNPPRDRLITDHEIKVMLETLGQDNEVAIAFELALETAMRCSELLEAKYDIERRTATIEMTKNGDKRLVPLSKRACELVQKVGKFTITAQQLDPRFRSARERAGLSGFTFHDSRANALTRLARKVDVLTLARISGHKDTKMLMRYYRESVEDIAARLD